jgi:hypothetical protein
LKILKKNMENEYRRFEEYFAEKYTDSDMAKLSGPRPQNH